MEESKQSKWEVVGNETVEFCWKRDERGRILVRFRMKGESKWYVFKGVMNFEKSVPIAKEVIDVF